MKKACVLRGGSWSFVGKASRCANRVALDPSPRDCDSTVGFRPVAPSLPEERVSTTLKEAWTRAIPEKVAEAMRGFFLPEPRPPAPPPKPPPAAQRAPLSTDHVESELLLQLTRVESWADVAKLWEMAYRAAEIAFSATEVRTGKLLHDGLLDWVDAEEIRRVSRSAQAAIHYLREAGRETRQVEEHPKRRAP